MQPTLSTPGSWSPSPRAQPVPLKQTILVAASEADLPRYVLPAFEHVTARTNEEIAALLARERPIVAVIDGDLPGLDPAAACTASRNHEDVSVLVTIAAAEQVPLLLKAGCHAVLMKPFATNLLAGRVGRLVRARTQQPRRRDGTRIVTLALGTNRAWEAVTCPRCSEPNAVSFDFTSDAECGLPASYAITYGSARGSNRPGPRD